MRVYIPAHVDQLSSVVSGRWEPAVGFAATELLLGIVDSDDPDEVSEIARDAAALASVVDSGSPLRLVIVADLVRSEVELAPDLHPAAVRLTEHVPAAAIACAFMDEAAAAEDARAAVNGDEQALDRLEEHELLWYDATEIAHLPV